MATAVTNDLGEYRVFGVAAGKYRLRATLRMNTFNNTGEQEDYAPTYYPGQTDPAGATLIDLQPGQVLRGVDMVVQSAPTHRVRGKVAFTSVAPDFIQINVALREPGSFGMPQRGTVLRSGKTAFEFRLAPGSYNITASYNEGGVFYSGVTQVDVGNTDIDNVSLNLQVAADVSGRVHIDGASNLQALAQSNIRVSLFPKEFMMYFAGSNPGRVNPDDGAFTVKNVGVQAMTVNVSGLPQGYYVKSISYGQQDVKENGLTYNGSNDTLEVLVSPNGATITGTVHNSHGDPMPGATVVLVPPQRTDTRDFRITRTDQTGKFNMKGVPPNGYTVFAWEDIEPGSWMDPDVLKAAENQGKSLKLHEGSQESLDIESIPAADAPAAGGAF